MRNSGAIGSARGCRRAGTATTGLSWATPDEHGEGAEGEHRHDGHRRVGNEEPSDHEGRARAREGGAEDTTAHRDEAWGV